MTFLPLRLSCKESSISLTKPLSCPKREDVTALRCCFSKIIPSFFTIKEGSTFLTKPLFPQGREDVTALRCSEPLRYRVGGPIKGLAMLCGMGPPGDGKKYNFFYYSDRYLTIQGFNSGMSTSIVSHRLSGSMV